MTNAPETSFLAGDTVASNPGRLSPNLLRFALAFPRWPMIWMGALLTSLSLMVAVHWAFAILAAILLVGNGFYWYAIYSGFRYGCVNPAVVVSREDRLIAVFTDLTTGRGDYPVIKVLHHPLSLMSSVDPRVGTRLATIATYRGDDEERHWRDFHPHAVNCVTTDGSEIRRVLQSIPAEDWDSLQRGLQQVPRPFKPGLYFVDPQEQTNW